MGSNPPTVLLLIAFVIALSTFRWLWEKTKEGIMKQKSETKRSKTVLSLSHNAAKLVTHFVETIWAIGISMVAGTVPIPIY